MQVFGWTTGSPHAFALSSRASRLGSRIPLGILRCGTGWATSFPLSSDWESRWPGQLEQRLAGNGDQ